MERRKTMLEVEREEQRVTMMESYRSLIINHFDNQTDEVHFSGVKVNGKNEGFCEVLTCNYFFKGFFKGGEKDGRGIIQIKSDFHEPLGLDGITELKSRSVTAINKGGPHQTSRRTTTRRSPCSRAPSSRTSSRASSTSS